MDEPKVVSYTSKKRLRPSKRVLLTIVLIVLALACGGTLAWLQNRDDTKAPPATGVLEERLPEDVKEIQELALSGKADEAQKKIDEGLAASGVSNETKYNLLTQQGINQQNAGQNKEALASYKEAEAVRQEFKISKLIADVAAILGDKQAALDYYKKAIGQLDRNSPIYEAEKERLEAKVKELEA